MEIKIYISCFIENLKVIFNRTIGEGKEFKILKQDLALDLEKAADQI